MCILLKLEYPKFDVPNFFFQKLSKENLWGDRLDPCPPPSLGNGRVKPFLNLNWLLRVDCQSH